MSACTAPACAGQQPHLQKQVAGTLGGEQAPDAHTNMQLPG